MRVTFDIETNKPESFHTLEGLEVIHCVALSVDGAEPVLSVGWEEIGQAVAEMELADELESFNGDRFDLPVIRSMFPDREFPKSRDLLVCAKVIWPTEDLKHWDHQRLEKGEPFPHDLIGRHSLKAWGFRLGVYKGDVGDSEDEETWEKYTPEMGEYCKQDVEICLALSKYIDSHKPSPESLDIEHRFARILWDQEKHGFAFDKEGGLELLEKLERKRAELKDSLADLFPPFEDVYYTKVKKLKRIKKTPFNPNSANHHIPRAFSEKYGWKPTKFTKSGLPKMDESVLKDIPYPEAKPLLEAAMIQKRIGQLAEGKKAWLKMAQAEGRVHGWVDHNGAGTNRCTHSSPNMTAVPKVGKPIPCRHLFTARGLRHDE